MTCLKTRRASFLIILATEPVNKMNLLIRTTIISVIATASNANATNINQFINTRSCDQVIDKKFYKICYDYKAKGAKFVAYTLKGKNVGAVNIKKRPSFYPEKSIPSRYRTYPSDYTHNEFKADRGHLAPDAAFDWSKDSLDSVYSMANIIPQYRSINRHTWIKAERYARSIAIKLGEVTVINGVEYGSQRMKKSGIAYPKGYWKMLCNDAKGFKRCLYYKNSKTIKTKGDKLKDHVVDCSTLT